MGLRFLGAAFLLVAHPAYADAVDDKGASWIRRESVTINGAVDKTKVIGTIARHLGSAKVYGLGEATHGTHEDQAIKAAVIKSLIKSGKIEVLALEANRAAGARLDEFVRVGKGGGPDIVKASGIFMVWQNEAFAGLIEWIARWNRSHPRKAVRVIGIDVQDGGNDAAAAVSFIRQVNPALAERLEVPLGPILPAPGKTARPTSQWIAKSSEAEVSAMLGSLRALEGAFSQHRELWKSRPDYELASYAARTAVQNLEAFELDRGDAKLSQAAPEYISRRDRFMAQNLLARLGSNERAALWAHDMHVLENLPEPAAAAGFATVGSILQKALGESYRTLGFTYSVANARAIRTGQRSALEKAKGGQAEVLALRNDGPGTLGFVFSKALPAKSTVGALIDPVAQGAPPEWTAKPYWRGWAGNSANPESFQTGADGDFPLPLAKGHDLIVWIRTLTPSRKL